MPAPRAAAGAVSVRTAVRTAVVALVFYAVGYHVGRSGARPAGRQEEAEDEEAGGFLTDSRGDAVRVMGYGIAEALRVESPSASAAEREAEQLHRSGGDLSPDEIERLPMYRYTFSHRRLPSGRKRMVCPLWADEADLLQIPLKHLPRKRPTTVDQKYDRRASLCLGNGIWHRVSLEDHMNILKVIVGLLGVKRGDHVYDWGSGCGHKLRHLAEQYGTTGFGLDVSEKSVHYALVNTTSANHFCRANGARTETWMPENYFSHALSFGSVYHVYNRTVFCDVIRSMVRVVRAGGSVYNGWTDNSEFRRADVAACLSDLPVTFKILEEKTAFSDVGFFPLKGKQGGRPPPPTYSLVVRKQAATTAANWRRLPLTCDEKQCVQRAA
eukprot:TRINITY_DN7813_c0_g1_i2.p1 TRINITY_DN7813_c0_g1~~TRINITY_DN7813_c0_g1_i2.p1  ORF type:complete len:416 (+),score=148.85 TRINITY_DN7813_c0_g1_i2:100-1248(+)